MMEDMRIYVASLSDYNDGRLEGKWFDLSDYPDASDLMMAIQEMLDELTEKYNDGEVREEWAVHDYEGIPSTLASEYMGEQDFQQLYDIAIVAEEYGVPLEVLMERAGDTGSDDYKALAESLMFVVQGRNEADIVMEWEDQMGELGSDFWSNHIYIDDVTERVIYGEDVDRFRDDILSENPDMDEAEAEAEAERMADAEAEMREDLPSYLDEMGYGDTIPDFVSKDYEGAWKRSMSYDYDVIYHDGEMYVFSNNYSVGGTILSGMIGAYIGYKIGRSKPQKKGFSTEKRIGRKIKGAFSKKKYAEGGSIENLKRGDKITILGDTYEFLRLKTDNSQGYEEKLVVLYDVKDKAMKSFPLDMVEAYSKYAEGGEVAEYWQPIDESSIYRGVHDYSMDGIDDEQTLLQGQVWIKFKSLPKGVTNLPYEVKRAIESDFEYYGYSNTEYRKYVDLTEGSWWDYYINFQNLTYQELEELLIKLPEQVAESLEEKEIEGYGELGFNTYGNYIDVELSSDNEFEEEDDYAKGGGVSKFPIAIERRINEINKLLPKVKEADEIAGGYFGSTHYTYVQLEKPIEIKGKYVYIHSANGKYDMTFEKRYNVNKLGDEIDGRKSLNYDLSNILKAFKSVLKDNYAKGGAVKDKIKVRGFAPITKEEAMLLNEDFEENFNSNIERFTKHLNKVHNSKLRVIDTQSVIDFANQKPTTEELNNMTAFNLMEAMKYDKKNYESYKKALLKLYPDAKGFAEGGGVDEKFFHESRLLDYGFSKDIDLAGNRIYEKGLYKIVINPKDKTYTAILNGRPETHKIYDKKFALGRFIDLEFGTKYAKGGMLEHGLREGDIILGKQSEYSKDIEIADKNNKYGIVDLQKGQRWMTLGDVKSEYLPQFGENRYVGKTNSQVWNGWSENQRKHFLDDHRVLMNDTLHIRASKYRYNELPNDLLVPIERELKEHIERPSYAKGGGISGLDDLIRG
jgi:antirestriction protein